MEDEEEKEVLPQKQGSRLRLASSWPNLWRGCWYKCMERMLVESMEQVLVEIYVLTSRLMMLMELFVKDVGGNLCKNKVMLEESYVMTVQLKFKFFGCLSRSPKRPGQIYEPQKFDMEHDGFISSAVDRGLVLSVQEGEGRVQEVILTRRDPDNILQRWLRDDDNHILSKNNPQMVLTVAMPANVRTDYAGCRVTLQRLKTAPYGQANQKWAYDEATGNIWAFHTQELDKGQNFNCFHSNVSLITEII